MKTLDNFEKIAKKSRRKNRLVTIGVSLLVMGGLSLGAYIFLSKIVSKHAEEIRDRLVLMEEVAYPNIESYTLTFEPTSQFSGAFNAERFKNINGVLVEYPDYSQGYTLRGPWSNHMADSVMSKLDAATYTYDNMQKVPQFYNTNVQAGKDDVVNKPTQELPLVAEMEDQLVEVAITFDKPYTYGEIKKMIPENLMQNWYWIGSQTTGDTSQWRASSLFGTDGQGWTQPEFVDPAAAEKALKDSMERKEKKPDEKAMKTKEVDAFFTHLKAFLDRDIYSGYNDINPADDVKTYLETFGHLDLTKESDQNKLEFSGIILTGKAENFAQLEGKSWIYASSIGASIPNQPYYQLEKE